MTVMRLSRLVRRAAVASGPLPLGNSVARARGGSSDRVLLFGSGPAVGWGVLTHDLAIAGNLARTLAAHTGRGADVEVVADPWLSIRSSQARLKRVSVSRYDVIIIILGLGDASRFTSLRIWQQKLTGLLSDVTREKSRNALVFVTTVPMIPWVPGYGRLLEDNARVHAERMNQKTLEVVSCFAGVSGVELSAAIAGIGFRSNYERWARELETAITPRLEKIRQASEDTVAHDQVISEAQRSENVDRLRILSTGSEERFDRIVNEARAVFGTASAAFAVIDGDRLWFKSCVGAKLPPIDLIGSFTHATLSQRGALIIPDVLGDERFRDLPHVARAPNIRFWAGYPIEASNGVRVGTLSVFDVSPHKPDPSWDEAVLRDLALQIQAQVNS